MRPPGRPLCLALLCLALLAGCVPGGACPDALPPAVAACVGPVGGWTGNSPGGIAAVDVLVQGTVGQAGEGRPPVDCWALPHVGQKSAELPGRWLRVDVPGEDPWVIAFATDEHDAVLPALGEAVGFSMSFLPGGGAADLGSLALRDSSNQLVFWAGEGASASEIIPPSELAFVRAGRVCSVRDPCGGYSRYDLWTGLFADEQATLLPWGQTVQIDRFTVLHGGSAEVYGTSGTCVDWTPSRTHVAAWATGDR